MTPNAAHPGIDHFRLDDFSLEGAELTTNSKKVSFAPVASLSSPSLSPSSSSCNFPDVKVSANTSEPSSVEVDWFKDLLDRAASYGYKVV